MNWYNLTKKAISFGEPKRDDVPDHIRKQIQNDALQRAKEMEGEMVDSGEIPDETLDSLITDSLNTMGYPSDESEEGGLMDQPEEQPWDWEPEQSVKPSMVDPDEPRVNALLREMHDTITANEPAIIRKAKALYKGTPTFDHIDSIITTIADQLIATTNIPKDPIAQSAIITKLYEMIPPLFGTTEEELMAEQDRNIEGNEQGGYKRYRDY